MSFITDLFTPDPPTIIVPEVEPTAAQLVPEVKADQIDGADIDIGRSKTDINKKRAQRLGLRALNSKLAKTDKAGLNL